jgi:AraC-like DNA-binding protein
MYEISPIYARVVVRELSRRGLPSSPLFLGTTLDPEQLWVQGNISARDFNTLLLNARKLSADPELGLIIGRNSNIVTLGPLGAAIATAPSLREGLRALEAFSRVHTDYAAIELRSGLGGLGIYLSFSGIEGEIERFHVESAFLLLQSYIEMIGGYTLHDASIHFAYAAPEYAAAYNRVFHSPVSFESEVHSVRLPNNDLDCPSPFFQAELWTQAQLVLSERLSELTRNQQETYSRHIRALMRSSEPPLPDLASVARQLHISQRTLNRRLQQEQTTFRDIRTGELHSWARRYLAHTHLTVEAIGAVLGYQDAANFRRAFKAQQGCSPSNFRASN